MSVKSHLQNVNRRKRFIVTIDNAYNWYNLINIEIFDGCLTDVKIQISDLNKYYGEYEYNENYSQINIRKFYNSEFQFVNILAHEMVHHFQNNMNYAIQHDSSFNRWKTKYKQNGLTLKEIYK